VQNKRRYLHRTGGHTQGRPQGGNTRGEAEAPTTTSHQNSNSTRTSPSRGHPRAPLWTRNEAVHGRRKAGGKGKARAGSHNSHGRRQHAAGIGGARRKARANRGGASNVCRTRCTAWKGSRCNGRAVAAPGTAGRPRGARLKAKGQAGCKRRPQGKRPRGSVCGRSRDRRAPARAA
jgi:hypothetical protein